MVLIFCNLIHQSFCLPCSRFRPKHFFKICTVLGAFAIITAIRGSFRQNCIRYWGLNISTKKDERDLTCFLNFFQMNNKRIFVKNYSQYGHSKICGRQPLKILKGMICFKQIIPFKFFKSCLPQILLGPFLNTLSYL